jgi:SAM-dependent methyltransferase
MLARAKAVVAGLADRVYGIESQTQVHGHELGYDPASGYLHYQASSWLSVPGMFAGWEPAPGPGDVVIDLGCGKGRAMVQLARRYAFDRVLGVEFDAGLAEIARENLRRTRGRHKARATEVVVGDARSMPIPDDVTLVYIANPFKGAVFTDALDRIVESHDRRPRPMRIAYVHPIEYQVMEAHDRFRELPRPHASWFRLLAVDPLEFRRYELVPAPI